MSKPPVEQSTTLEQTLINETENVPDLCTDCDTPVPEGEKCCFSCAGEWAWIDVRVDDVLLGRAEEVDRAQA